MPWGNERLPGRIRYKLLQLDPEGEQLPRYYWPDVQAFMMAPPMRKSLEFVPVFTVQPLPENSFHMPTQDEPIAVPLCWRIEQAAQFLDVCRDSIENRMIEWQDESLACRVRCGRTELKIGRNFVRVCYRPDVEALLKTPDFQESLTAETSFHRSHSHKGF